MTNPNLIKLAQRLGNKELPREKTAEPVKPKQISIDNSPDFWTIPNGGYKIGVYTVDLAKQLLGNGSSKPQDEWIEYSKQAQQNNNFYAGNFPLYHSIFTALFNNKDGNQKDEIEEIRQFIKQQMLDKWLMTLTRIIYAPKGQKDKVMHNYGMPNSYAIELDSFIGPDGFIKNTDKVKEPLQALLDTQQDVKEINSVYKWLTDVDAYIWRINSDVQNIDERVAGFGAGSVGAYLWCNRDPRDSYSALGVRVVRKK